MFRIKLPMLSIYAKGISERMTLTEDVMVNLTYFVFVVTIMTAMLDL